MDDGKAIISQKKLKTSHFGDCSQNETFLFLWGRQFLSFFVENIAFYFFGCYNEFAKQKLNKL